MTPTVVILTYGAHPALAYGTLLVFKTLRLGFPNARVEVYDNGSHPEVRDQVMRACVDVDADFVALRPQHWVDHYRAQLLEREDDGAPLVLVDPDVAFWGCVEEWDFADALMAGRLMRAANEGVICSHARLHPSMLWVQSLGRLREHLVAGDIAPRVAAAPGQVDFWDTLGVAYARLGSRCAAFEPAHLDRYDHLFFGTHMPVLDALLGDAFDVIRRGHQAAAAGDLQALRGAWRSQEAYFNRPVDAIAPAEMASHVLDLAEDALSRQLVSLERVQRSQGMAYGEDELLAALATLEARMRPHPATA